MPNKNNNRKRKSRPSLPGVRPDADRGNLNNVFVSLGGNEGIPQSVAIEIAQEKLEKVKKENSKPVEKGRG